MMEGLREVSHLLQIHKIKAELYLNNPASNKEIINPDFEKAILELYVHILEYQAYLHHYLSQGSFQRGVRNAFKNDDWKVWLDSVKKSESKCCEYTALFDNEAEKRARKDQYEETRIQRHLQEQVLEAMRVARKERKVERDEERLEKLVQHLSTSYREQKDFNPERVPGTCEWFLDNEKFRTWRSATDSRLLWVSAGPGCGKSVLARCLIDEYQASNTLTASTVAYFSFKEGLEGRQRPENALKAITHQLLTQHQEPALAEHALSKFQAHGEKLGEMFGELWNCLVEAAKDSRAGEIVCILDALVLN